MQMEEESARTKTVREMVSDEITWLTASLGISNEIWRVDDPLLDTVEEENEVISERKRFLRFLLLVQKQCIEETLYP